MNNVDAVSLKDFLEYGPIGLAGLMLVLVVLALNTRELTEAKASLLKFFMVIGGMCFAALVMAELVVAPSSYRMNVAVVPSNLEETPHAAPPALEIDGMAVAHGAQHQVDRDFSLLIDLTTTVETAETAMEDLRADLQSELETLEARTAHERADLEARLGKVALELERFEAIQEVLSDLQSDAPSTDVLEISLGLNRQLRRFMSNIGAMVKAPSQTATSEFTSAADVDPNELVDQQERPQRN